jgi:DNA-directed RNA polymerase subunit RPC12/RpoP/uncharacterized membrane protein
MEATLTKCWCTHCKGHIEFDSDAAGETIQCPHCQQDTVLFVPRPGPRSYLPEQLEPEPEAPPIAKDKTIWIRRGVITAGALFILVSIGAVIRDMMKRGVFGEFIGRSATGLFGVIVAVAILFWIVMWLLFPIVVYFQLKRMNETLADIRDGKRP